MSEEVIKSYKGFDKDLKCRCFQYEIGGEYEMDGPVKARESGFHACKAPLDVLRYYGLNKGNRYCAVEQSGVLDVKGDDSKVASSKIKVGAEIGLQGLIKAHFEYTREKAVPGKTAGGEYSNLAGGYKSNLAGGYKSNLAGGYGSNLAGGVGSNLAGGYRSNLAGGESSLCVVRNGKAKGGMYSILCLTEWKFDGSFDIPLSAKAIIIDGETYKPDVWYTLQNGEIVEADT